MDISFEAMLVQPDLVCTGNFPRLRFYPPIFSHLWDSGPPRKVQCLKNSGPLRQSRLISPGMEFAA
jgi:hypothetical protein